MKMNILVLLPCMAMTLCVAQSRKVDPVKEGEVAVSGDKHEMVTKYEFVHHLKNKINWIKRMPQDEKDVLIDIVAWKLENARKQLKGFLEKLTPEQKEKLSQLHETIEKVAGTIKSMTPQEKAIWKKTLHEELEELRKHVDEIREKIGTLKNDADFDEVLHRIHDVADWVKEVKASDKEVLKKLLHAKVALLKKELELLKGTPKYEELKGKIAAIKETISDVAELKEHLLEVYQEMHDALEEDLADDRDEKMTQEEFVQHLKDKISWIKNMSKDEKQALLKVAEWKLDHARKQLEAYLEKLTPAQKQKLTQLHDGIKKIIQQIKSMNPTEKMIWRKILHERLEDLKEYTDEISEKLADLKDDEQLQKILHKIHHIADWIDDAPKSDKEMLKELFQNKMEHLKKHTKEFFELIDDQLKQRVETIKESLSDDIEALKESMKNIYQDLHDEIAKAKKH